MHSYVIRCDKCNKTTTIEFTRHDIAEKLKVLDDWEVWKEPGTGQNLDICPGCAKGTRQ